MKKGSKVTKKAAVQSKRRRRASDVANIKEMDEDFSKASVAADAAAKVAERIAKVEVPIEMGHIETQKDYDAKLKELTDFYEKKIYDLEQMLDISRSFSSEIELYKLLESIKYICMAQMHVLSVNIFIRGSMDETDTFTLASGRDDTNVPIGVKYEISINHPLIKELCKERLAMTPEALMLHLPEGVLTPVIDALKPTLIVPIVEKSTLNGIVFLGERIAFDGQGEYTDYEKSQIMSIATLAAVAISNASLVEKSSTDMMTRLKLKYYFFNVLEDRLCDAAERKRKLSVLMFDIDHFKIFNDTYGHECGDYVLITVASLIKQCLRDSDLASRYGGEEFTVLLDDTDSDDAVLVAERIREAVENEVFTFDGKELHVTISGGVATYDDKLNPCIDPKVLVDQADQGLYMSKHNGRNGVTYANPALLRKE